MGIKGNFNKFLRDICPEVFETIHISEYAYKKVAIDISLYLHKFKAVCGDRWLSAFINLIACLRRNEVHCVFIFDGKSPPEKDAERAKRREDREKMEKQLYELEEAIEEYHNTGVVAKCLSDLYARRRSPKRLLGKHREGIDMAWVESKIEQRRNQLYDIAPEDFEHAKDLFRILNVPFYTAPWEAEKMCSKLCLDGKVAAVLSEDTDVMAYAAPMFLTKIDTAADTCVRISHEALLEGLDLTPEQLLDLCIMCGTDYNPNIPRVGSKTAYKRIVQHGGIEQIAQDTTLDTSVLKHIRVRELFTDFEDYKLDTIPFCGTPDFEKLEMFVIGHEVQVNIDKLRMDFTHKEIVFEDSEEEEEIILEDSDEE
jgi:5'-3' exonuclease